jgi:hypothetical protein
MMLTAIPDCAATSNRAAKPMLVRFADGDAMLICPPSRSDNQGWLEYPRH